MPTPTAWEIPVTIDAPNFGREIVVRVAASVDGIPRQRIDAAGQHFELAVKVRASSVAEAVLHLNGLIEAAAKDLGVEVAAETGNPQPVEWIGD